MSSRTIFFAVSLLLGLVMTGCGIGTIQADLRDGVDARQATLDECYRVALEENPNTAGQMSVRITVDKSSSTVSDVELLDAADQSDSLILCVRDVLLGVAIDPPSKANVTVDYTLDFQQGAR